MRTLQGFSTIVVKILRPHQSCMPGTMIAIKSVLIKGGFLYTPLVLIYPFQLVAWHMDLVQQIGEPVIIAIESCNNNKESIRAK